MKYSAVLLLIVAIVVGCSVKVTTPGRALVTNKTVEDVFSIVVQAVSESEFIVVSLNKGALSVLTVREVSCPLAVT